MSTRVLQRPKPKKAAPKTRSFIGRDLWVEQWGHKGPTGLDSGLRKGLIATIKQEGDDGDRALSFTISTATPDRDRDTIDVAGWQLENYEKNPVVLWAHNPWDPPIAKATAIAVEEDALKSTAEFAGADVYPFADTIFQLLKGGFLNATSVGFWPAEWTFNEERGGIDFKVQELWEYSIVPIPSNPDALIEARSAGIDLDPLREWGHKALENWTEERGLFVPRSQLKRAIQVLASPKSVFDFGTAFDKANELLGQGVAFDKVLDEISKSQEPVPVSGIWLRTVSDGLQVLAEVEGKWRIVIEEAASTEDLMMSHIVEPSGILDGDIDDLKEATEAALKQATLKRGRVLSKKNEDRIRSAVENLNEVLKSLEKEDEEEEEEDDDKGNPTTPTTAGEVVLEIDDDGDTSTSTGISIDGLDLEADDLKELIASAVKVATNGLTGRVD